MLVFVALCFAGVKNNCRNFRHVLRKQVVDVVRMQFFARLEQALFFAAFRVLYEHGACKHLVNQRVLVLCVNSNFFGRVKRVDNLFARTVAERTQENRAQDFLFAVDFGVNQLFFLVDFKFKPRTAIRNNAAGIHAFFVVKNNARRAVNLGDDDALRTVDDKGATVGHNRNVAHVDVFLQNCAGLQKVQIDACFERNSVGQALFLTFLFRKLNIGFVKLIKFILKRHIPVGAFNRERVVEHFLQAFFFQRLFFFELFSLKETFIRRRLNVD